MSLQPERRRRISTRPEGTATRRPTPIRRPPSASFDPDALRRSTARSATSACGRRQRAVRRDRGRVRALRRGPVRRADRARAADRRGRRRRHRRRLRRAAGRRPLREAGVDDIRMIEKGGDFGGTWYWNRYPGAMCDVESYIYLPLLEEVGYVPKEKYTHAPEILAHSRAIGEHFDLYRNALLPDRGHRAALGRRRRALDRRAPTAATRCAPASCAWRTGRCTGRSCRASPASTLQGPLVPHQPLGLRLHRRRHRRRPRRLRDKRVGIIGTGATAVQCVPHLGEAAEHLYVFQRTPSSIDVRGNRPTDPEWAASRSSPAGRSARMDNFNTLVSGGFADEDLVSDGWTDIIGKLLIARAAERERRHDAGEPRDARWSSPTSRRWSRSAPASTRSSRTRPPPRRSSRTTGSSASGRASTTSTSTTFNRPNVTLVDTHGQGRRAHHREGHRRQRRRVRGRLHHLRDRLRGRHRRTPAAPATSSTAATA